MLKGFRKLKTRIESQAFPGGVCKEGHSARLWKTWKQVVKNQEHCVICASIVNLLGDEYKGMGRVQYCAEFCVHPPIIPANPGGPFAGIHAITLTLEYHTYSRTYDQFNPIENEDGHVCDKYVFVHDSQETQTPQFQSRRRRMLVDERQVNFDLIRRWLQECETEHRDACNTHKWETVTETPPILRVIDVQNNCLCSAPPNCRYTTLSYVWSKNPRTAKLFKQNIAHLSEKDGLLGYFDNMPQTILDAMELTRKIGERYLWVDALCIIQDSLDEQAQIGAMDSIYQNSLLTIVAASGEDSNAGLPGVIRDSRPGHPQQEVRTTAAGVQLFLEIPSPPSLALSKWNSRGWCFQEKLLSRRLLVFVDQQIFWHCNYTNWNEDMSTKIHRENKAVLKGLRLKDDIRGVTAQGGKIQNGIEKRRDGSTCVVRTGTFAAYISALEDFKARDLGRATDAINAFGGILKILSPWFQSEMLYGLPESILDCALLWQPVTPLIPNPERESFPSWSWAGWIGSIQYERPYMIDKQSQRQVEKDEAPEERVRPVVRWYKRNIETQRFDKVNGSGSGLRFSVDKYGEVPNTWTEYDWVDMTLKDQIEPLEGRPISSSHLRFWTNHAYFLLQPSVYGISLIQSPASQSVNSAVVGYIVLTEGKDPTSPNRPDDARGAAVELIVLSEAQFFGQPASLNNTKDKRKEHYPYVKHNSSEYTIRQWDIELGYKHGQYELYNVMLVQRTGPIWYRSGLGRIYKKGWHQADPKPKLITLG